MKCFLTILISLFVVSCTKCDLDQATQKLFVLGKIQSRMSKEMKGVEAQDFIFKLGRELGQLSVEIAKGNSEKACELAGASAKRISVDLEEEQQQYGKITPNPGVNVGKIALPGQCSVPEAIRMHMQLYTKLQNEITAGNKAESVLDELAEYPELLALEPLGACFLLTQIAQKHEITL